MKTGQSSSCTRGAIWWAGLCRAGFAIEDLVEPMRADVSAPAGEIGHRGRYVPPYVRIKARRTTRETRSASRLWIP